MIMWCIRCKTRPVEAGGMGHWDIWCFPPVCEACFPGRGGPYPVMYLRLQEDQIKPLPTSPARQRYST